jgi:hypothetical protein
LMNRSAVDSRLIHQLYEAECKLEMQRIF